MGIDEDLTKVARSVLWGDGFRDRLVEELTQLNDRIGHLEAFILTNLFDDLDDIERKALREQCGHMRAYRDVLSARVSRLCGDA